MPDRYPRLLDKLFASRTEVDPEDADFFGAFAVDPKRPAAELDAAYGAGLGAAERRLTIAALIEMRLHGKAEYADRVAIGPIELIVRDVDENGRIIAVGLSFEPAATPPRIPVFLSAGEIGDRLARLIARFRNPRPAAAVPPAPTLPTEPSDLREPTPET